MSDSLLSVNNLCCGYKKKPLISGLSLNINKGEILALIGHNGAGKSTLFKAIAGLTEVHVFSGDIVVDGASILGASVMARRRKGIVYCHQGGAAIPGLTVLENLQLATYGSKISMPKEQIKRFTLDSFPELEGRWSDRAHVLSGGERQMLSLVMATLVSPKVLLLDEPTLGLSPSLVKRIMDFFPKITGNEVGVVIIEHRVKEVLSIAQRVKVLRNGEVSYDGAVEPLRDDAFLKEVYL